MPFVFLVAPKQTPATLSPSEPLDGLFGSGRWLTLRLRIAIRDMDLDLYLRRHSRPDQLLVGSLTTSAASSIASLAAAVDPLTTWYIARR